MKNMAGKVAHVQFLHDGSLIEYREKKDGSVNFLITGIKPDQTINVVEVFLK